MSEEAPAPRRRPQQRKQVLLRLDPSVYEALARWASDELRSANAQIEFLLRRALAVQLQDTTTELAEIIRWDGPGCG